MNYVGPPKKLFLIMGTMQGVMFCVQMWNFHRSHIVIPKVEGLIVEGILQLTP